MFLQLLIELHAGYQKTGDLITLPYTEEVFSSNPFASRVEKVAPLLSHEWVGQIALTPDTDEWFETEVAPELVVNVQGNFDAVLNANQNQIGTVWNAWQTQWSGFTQMSTVFNPRTDPNFDFPVRTIFNCV